MSQVPEWECQAQESGNVGINESYWKHHELEVHHMT